jgi:predicted RNA binding protein YcfA (HicA-like mRNA interferase family)
MPINSSIRFMRGMQYVPREIRDALAHHGFMLVRCKRHLVFRHPITHRNLVLSPTAKDLHVPSILRQLEKAATI